MSNSTKVTEQDLTLLRRKVERCRESLRAVEDAPNRGQWDYPTALRLAQERLNEAEAALNCAAGVVAE